MINVTMKPEPTEFDSLVRVPGLKFLKSCAKPTQQQWKSNSYWRKISQNLHTVYSGICSYSCHWIPFDTGYDTVEHFRPKSKYPKEAYEWSNYRLVCHLLNARKKIDETILDPFKIDTEWFMIEFPSLLVKPAPNVSENIKVQVEHTCKVLGLNDEDSCLSSRMEWVKEFCLNNVNFAHLEKRAPFLATELKRQGYDAGENLNEVMKITKK